MHKAGDLYPLLSELILAPGVSGNEGSVARVVEQNLKAAGFDDTQISGDAIGNRWVQLGPQGEPVRMLLAHMDEIGWRITAIREDGCCRLAAVGGLDAQLWEGAPVVVHTADGPVPGCIAPLSHHVSFRLRKAESARMTAEDLLLDVGASSPKQVASLGIGLLDTVTWPKRIDRLYGELVQARSLDDRFGCCAMLLAVRALRESSPPVPTILAWPVQEEVGLRGAKVLARRFPNLSEVIAVDSFTTGTGPRDNKQYDMVRLGDGPVLRSWDSTILVPDEKRRMLLDKAFSLGFTLQYGYMPGGNDASVFEEGGARVFGLGVPVQYSHTAAERIHLGDLARLADLLTAWCGTHVGAAYTPPT
ncbi:M20/M25/M40 family metallo-hydrolase [bacterium]|nr:M20/M25/M40 family metallo-hydrolase [bacterium]